MKKEGWAKLLLKGAAVFTFLIIVLAWFYFQPVDSDYQGEPKIFVVRKGQGSEEIGISLEKEGLIHNRYSFWLAVQLYRLGGKLQAGSFRLSPAMSLKEISFVLTKGRLDQWVTIIEGLRREEVAKLLEKEMALGPIDFLKASEKKEGFLFPDTYLFPRDSSGEKIVSIMTDNFEKRTKDIWKEEKERELSKEQILIFASLVEREGRKDEDRQKIAGVLIKRWQNNWPLQVDAAVQYAKASRDCSLEKDCDWWPAVSGADLKIESDYNTYHNLDLPPFPICNPSLSSLRAVLNYQPSDYWFYLSDRQGNVHFSKTLEEHQLKVNKYLK